MLSGLNLIRQNRANGIGQHEFGMRRVFGKPCLQATQRAAGANAYYHGINPACQLVEQLRCGGGGVRQRVGRVRELINIVSTRRLLCQAAGVVLIVLRVALCHVGAGQAHINTQRTQVVDLLMAHLVRHHQHQLIALLRSYQRQPEPGITCGGFNNGAAGNKQTLALGLVDHRQRHPVFDRAAGVLVLQLEKKRAWTRVQFMQLKHRGLTD